MSLDVAAKILLALSICFIWASAASSLVLHKVAEEIEEFVKESNALSSKVDSAFLQALNQKCNKEKLLFLTARIQRNIFSTREKIDVKMKKLKINLTNEAYKKLSKQFLEQRQNLLWWRTGTFMELFAESHSNREPIMHEKPGFDFLFLLEGACLLVKIFQSLGTSDNDERGISTLD